MAGRVAGVTISSTGAAGSSVSMVIRGAKSLSSDNQPLFVVDGVPLASSLNNVSQIGDDNRVDYGNTISDINPDNIETISVLKGASAAALYGSRAANGVVMITTKSGSRAKKLTISFSSNTSFDVPYKFLDFQKKYAAGYRPYTPTANPDGTLTVDETQEGGVGPELDKGYNAIQWNSPLDANGNRIPTPLVSHPNNVKNFVQTGITSTNTIAISNNTDLLTYNLSYTNMRNKGIVPNSDLFRNSLDFSTSMKLSNKLRLNTNIDFTQTNSNNRPGGARGTNPLEAAYRLSPHVNILDLKEYWVKGQEGLQQLTPDGQHQFNNPYFLANEVKNSFVRDRVYGNAKLDYQITKEFSLMGRYSLDTYREQRETKIGSSYTNEIKGAYGIININHLERNFDFLATYKKDLDPINLTVSVGGNNRYSKDGGVTTASQSGTGNGLILPGVYTIDNIPLNNLAYGSYSSQKGVYSAYALANLGFKDMLFLDLTARNDWSSTLPPENNSYFYPSASLSALVNEMVHLSSKIDMLKVRLALGQVGNDTSPYQLQNTLYNAGAWNGLPRLSQPGGLLTPNLKPEISTTKEVGAELLMFNGRLKFEGTYYSIENKNQIISVGQTPSSGYTSRNINAGLLASKGLELTVGGTPIQKDNFRWNVSLNYSRNRTTIVELAPGVPYYTLWAQGKGGAWTYVGETIGDIYDAQLVTVEDKTSKYFGYPILDQDGSFQNISASNTKNKIGNFNPNFIIGAQSSVIYKAFSLNLSFDWRQGGQYVSQTFRYADSDFKTDLFLKRQMINGGGLTGDNLRNYLVANEDKFIKGGTHIVGGPTSGTGGFPITDEGITLNDGTFNAGVIAQYDSNGDIVGYTENLGGPDTKLITYGNNYPWDFTKPALFDASFVKLREVTFGYQLPASFIKSIGLESATFSLYVRNIMLWTKAKNGIDPERAFQPQANGRFNQGIEQYNVTPWTISTGFKLSLTF